MMKPFHTVAIPHQDILDEKFSMNIFAADLWETYQNRGPIEYRDSRTYFEKTYITDGLKNLFQLVKNRIEGKGGDPVIQIQTPFGGGKSHTLIGIFHKAKEWNANVVVIVGTVPSSQETLWGIIEQQLTGKIQLCKGNIAPGREIIRKLLLDRQPLIILIDELLEYVTKVAAVKIGDSNLASQTLAFLQELTEVISSFEKSCLLVTLPSSFLEHYDEISDKIYNEIKLKPNEIETERHFNQLQKISGRVESIYTPIQDNEVCKVIRKRLFSHVDEDYVKEIVKTLVDFLEKEKLIPNGVLPTEYRDRCIESYPFLPETIDYLYYRWGSLPTFQRTRGVLRLLSLVIGSQRKTNKPFLSIADFDLSNQEIRQELIKHIGSPYNSVIAQDITASDSGSRKADISLGDAYQGLMLATRTATAIFVSSFSGGEEKGCTLTEIKRFATTFDNPSSLISEAVEQLKSKYLFFLQMSGERYYFDTIPNINRILVNAMENITESQTDEEEKELIKKNVKADFFKTYIWEINSTNIADNADFKLVIIKKEDKKVMNTIQTTKGQNPRVHRNTVFFLYPNEMERPAFDKLMKIKIAFERINNDKTLSPTSEQIEEIKAGMKKAKKDVEETIARLYRVVGVPQKDQFKTIDLGVPTFGEQPKLDKRVYDILRTENEILEKIVPSAIIGKYILEKDYVFTNQVYQASLKTPGEIRFKDINVLKDAIIEGVMKGDYGLGELKKDEIVCKYFKDKPTVEFSDNEILIAKSKVKVKLVHEPIEPEPLKPEPPIKPPKPIGPEQPKLKSKKIVNLKFTIPKGKISQLLPILNLIQLRFNDIQIQIKAQDGEMTEEEYENKIKEALSQLGIQLE